MKIVLVFLVMFLCYTGKKSNRIHNHKKERKLSLESGVVDIRGLLGQKRMDNPLGELWDTNHIKVARQKVNMNLNMPINRLKLNIDNSYVVKIITHNDNDFNSLYNYFYGEDR